MINNFQKKSLGKIFHPRYLERFFIKSFEKFNNNTIFDGAHLIYAYFDENWDTYDDMSYGAGAESGDLNLDGVDNVLDVVLLVNNILNP